MDTFDNSDSETFSETSNEDQDDIFSIYSGQAQSILSNLEDSIGKLDDFLCFERAYAHGDIVSSVSDPSGQIGKIVNVNMFVDLENIFGKSVTGLDSRQLCRIRTIVAGDHVVNGPWIGRVDRVVDRVEIKFDDGTKNEIMATEAEMMIPISPNLLEESLHPYHPGQRVKVALSSVSKSSGWLCGMLKKTHQEGVISSVKAGSVHVDWLAFALTCGNDHKTTISPPPCIQDPKDLTVLHCFPHTNWLHGEYCILGSCLNGMMMSNKYNKDFGSKLEDMYSIARKKRTYDVIWQDGSMSIGLESRSIVPVTAVNATDFFPEDIVIEKSSFDDLNVNSLAKWGVVKYVDANERTVKVEWKAMSGSNNIALDGKLSEEMVSAYELVEHPEFNFSFGDIVFLLEKNYVFGPSDVPIMKKDKDRDSDENHFRSFLSNIGVVVGFKGGDVQVQWASGITTQVAPFQIIRMDKDEGSLATLVVHEESVTNQEEKQSLQQEEKDSLDVDDDDVAEVSSASFGIRQAAIGFFLSLATKFLGSNGSTSQGNPLEDADVWDEGEILQQEVLSSKELAPMATDDLNSCEDENVKRKTESTLENGDVLPTSCNRQMEEFKQFDIAKRGWLKKVQQEWSILERDLPETIYVRIYEERMDLIRAAIVGASGTPYHDGLFFFDIFLPPDYPNEPPSVYYHSGGLCLNPNLYESGRVCLSLLNTWRGTGTEVWSPAHSTILQVLVSLQALVLNEKPYFNEAGYHKQIGRLEGEKNSVSYNENAFLVTCRSMLYLLKNPPNHFEGLVEEHFMRRSKHILVACKAYMEGTPVGSFGQENSKITSHQDKENSMGFKIMLAKLFPKLVEAFSAIGADCSELIES
ncbi:hypothetical protein V2J09_019514 [Rumex salicifolius]